MRASLRLPVLVFAASAAAMLAVSPALAQGAGGQPTEGGAAAAGGVPALQQQQPTTPQQDNEPARAPGSTADGGVAMPLASSNSGTTESFAAASTEEQVAWPCAQRKVPTISAGTLWSGPNIAEGKGWDEDNKVAELAQKLASRRLPIDKVDPLIAAFAKNAGADKDKKLTELFVGTLDIINGSRDEILDGIMRYARGQERLAERMRKEGDAISEKMNDVQGPTGLAATTDQKRDFAWDQRIFKERRQALTYVCETPSLLERRAYDVSSRIQAQL